MGAREGNLQCKIVSTKHLRDGDLHGKTSEKSIEKLRRLFLYSLEELAARTTQITAAAEIHSQ